MPMLRFGFHWSREKKEFDIFSMKEKPALIEPVSEVLWILLPKMFQKLKQSLTKSFKESDLINGKNKK
jgi:hypothetical protein